MASERKNSQYYNSICHAEDDLSGDSWDEVLSQENNEILTFIIYNTDKYYCISKKSFIINILTDYYFIERSFNNLIQNIQYVKFPFARIRINKNIIQQIEDGYSLFYLYPNNNIYLSIPFNKNVLYQNSIREIREMANELIGQYEMPNINVNNLNYFRLVYDELRLNADPFYVEQQAIYDERNVLPHIEDIELRNQAEQQLIERQNALSMRRRAERREENMDNILSPEELQRQRDEARQRARQQLIENNPELQISQEERNTRFREREREIEEKEYVNIIEEKIEEEKRQFIPNNRNILPEDDEPVFNSFLNTLNNSNMSIIEQQEFINLLNQNEFDLDRINLLFYHACVNGHLEIVRSLFLNRNVDIHAEHDDALRTASENGHLEVVRFLIENGANIHAEHDQALRYASKNGYLDIVRLLLENDANVNAYHNEALRNASENGYLEIVELLIENGANIHADRDESVCLASENGHLEVVRFLVENGANIQVANNYALRNASRNGHLEVVRLLLDNEADIHAENDLALIFATQNGHLEVIRLLLQRGANIHTYNDAVLYHAFLNNRINIVEFLLNNGAVINRDIINILQHTEILENGNYRYRYRNSDNEFSPELVELIQNTYEEQEQQRNRQ